MYADTPAADPVRALPGGDRRAAVLAQAAAGPALRDRGIGRVEIRKRGSALEPEQLRRDLRLSGGRGESGADPGGRRADRARRAPVAAGHPLARRSESGYSLSAMAGQGTPATALLAQRKVSAHSCTPYDVDARRAELRRPGRRRRSGSRPERVFKSLVTEVDGGLTVAVVPVTGELDLKALAAAVGGKRAGDGRPCRGRAGHRLRPRRHQPARPAQAPPDRDRRLGAGPSDRVRLRAAAAGSSSN